MDSFNVLNISFSLKINKVNKKKRKFILNKNQCDIIARASFPYEKLTYHLYIESFIKIFYEQWKEEIFSCINDLFFLEKHWSGKKETFLPQYFFFLAKQWYILQCFHKCGPQKIVNCNSGFCFHSSCNNAHSIFSIHFFFWCHYKQQRHFWQQINNTTKISKLW